MHASGLFEVQFNEKNTWVVPRVGWVVASRAHIEIFRNYSSFAMGDVDAGNDLPPEEASG